MKTIVAITGTRADYGIYRSVLKSIVETPDLKLSLIVVGMHLSSEFGLTFNEIKADGFEIGAKINILHTNDTPDAMAISVGKSVVEISKSLHRLKPDIVLVLGDRSEMLAAAVSATYSGLPIAHIHGGDISGNVDEPVRHAITKLAHIHFAATPQSAERILKMGEESWRVHVVGAPGLDSILSNTPKNNSRMANLYGVDFSKPLLLVVQHPVVAEVENAACQMRETLEAIKELGLQTIIVYPNADAGGRRMINVIQEYEKTCPFIRSFKSIPREDYLQIMSAASVMIGNSSSGIIEAHCFGLPVVNIGTRQMGRQRAGTVIDVDYVKEEIVKTIQNLLNNTLAPAQSKGIDSCYGAGNAGKRIAKILAETIVDEKLIAKRMMY